MSHRTPPRWLEELAGRVLGGGIAGDGALGDLAEGYHRLQTPRPVWWCNMWYAWQIVTVLAHRTVGLGRVNPTGALSGDLRWAVRVSTRRPLLTIGIVLTLGLGLGANAAVFSVIDGTFRSTSWWAEEDRALVLWPGRTFTRGQLSIFSEQAPSFDALGAYKTDAFSLAFADGRVVSVNGALISPELFARLRVHPDLGPGLAPEDALPGGTATVVVSRGLWLRELGGDPSVVGRRLAVNGLPRTIVGVQGDGGTAPGSDTDVWLPLMMDPNDPDFWPAYDYTLVGVLKAGMGALDGQADLRRFGATLSEMFPFFFGPDYLQDGTVQLAVDQERAMLRAPLFLLLGGTALLLLIAALNVGNMLLARSVDRRGELAVRRALGAERWQVVRQLAVESALLAALGTAIGVGAAIPGTAILPRLFPAEVSVVPSGWSSPAVILFVGTAALLAWAVLAGVPILSFLRSERCQIVQDIRVGARPAQTLLVAQSALATVLLVAAVVLTGSVANLRSLPLGFQPDDVTIANVSPPVDFLSDRGRLSRFQESAVERALGLPGATAAGMTSLVPLTQLPPTTPIHPEGNPVEVGVAVQATRFAVDEGYFEAMGIPLESGRLLGSTERSLQPSAVVVSRSLAERLWPGEDPVGRRIAIDPHAWEAFLPIVGVVGDVRTASLVEPPQPALYVSLRERPERATALVVRGSGDFALLAPAIRRAVQEADPVVPTGTIRSLALIVRDAYGTAWATMGLLVTLASLATLLAALGIHAVLANHVARHRREIGIRMALGAERTRLAAWIVGSGVLPAALGVVIGCALAASSGRALRAVLFGVSTLDAGAYVVPVLAVLVATAVAAAVPAVRAGRTHPGDVLRQE